MSAEMDGKKEKDANFSSVKLSRSYHALNDQKWTQMTRNIPKMTIRVAMIR
jgi:hypothetical protein